MNGAEQDTAYLMHGSIWTSSDDGVSWSDLTSNMTSTNVYGNNVIAKANGELLAATYGGGIYKSNGLALNAEELTFDESGVEVYPNPSRDQMTIRSEVEIRAYALVDLKGRKLKFENDLGENIHEINLNVSDLDTGIYTLILWIGDDKILVRKVSKL
ncbi:MAG: T9SS type A sorting domain-containing protein [Crocinitomicaceae bacterium]|nr:T9SS type A sorting domain-containing protein [Crocinitomicaceae bacterium]